MDDLDLMDGVPQTAWGGGFVFDRATFACPEAPGVLPSGGKTAGE
nr:hypothetical protein [uncultured Azospirillum sp.]